MGLLRICDPADGEQVSSYCAGPAGISGYDEERKGDFTSVEEIAAELAYWLIDHGYKEVACIYGCSMGGAIVTRFLADDRVKVRSAVIDGGITPYQLPWIATRFIDVCDFRISVK